jgi:hypothetical protein
MNELTYIYMTAALILGSGLFQVLRKRFDPFAPIWLFLVGYTQIYVVQALSFHEWALSVRGEEIVTAANFRAFWALAWFLGVYYLMPGRLLAGLAPSPPRRWSIVSLSLLCPLLTVWGLFCAGLVLRASDEGAATSAEASLILSFPIVLVVAGVLLIITGRQPDRPRPAFTAAGITIVLLYMLIWMFNGKRSHSLVAVLVGVCSFYIPRFRRPSYPVLLMTAATGAMAVGIAIGWRYYTNRHDSHRSVAGFVDFVTSFDPETVLESVNMKEKEIQSPAYVTKETEEYGGFLLMIATVPMKSEYDFGASYLRVFSTFIPRLIWPSKPIYGRDQWIAAWVAGSEMKREANFTGPAIGILGATQLNGGGPATLIVLGCIAVFLRGSYEYFRLHADCPWVQAWWTLFYYNSWFMVVNDDPCNWFYYNYGFTTLPSMVLLWVVNKFGGPDA